MIGRITKIPVLKDGFYAVVGISNDDAGLSIIQVGQLEPYKIQFKWEFMVSLISVAAVVWIIWWVFEVMMKKGRS